MLNSYLNNKIFIITDKNIYKIYEHYLKTEFKSFNYEIVIIRPNERSKSFKTYKSIINKLLNKKITKNDCLIAFGGGVVGDLTGFIAATLFRGIKYVNIPTTILSMADSSIGGKTAINTKYGKNLVGAFKQPSLVIIDLNFIKTLPKREYNSGIVEIIKAGLIKDSSLIDLLLADNVDLEKILPKAITVKKDIVEKDLYEKNERKLLNFGHSFAHAIEQKSNYKVRHGYAVSMGIELALKYGILIGLTEKNVLDKYYLLVKKYSLPKFKGNVKDYIKFLDYDKKVIKDKISFIFVKEIGISEIKEIYKEDLNGLSRT